MSKGIKLVSGVALLSLAIAGCTVQPNNTTSNSTKEASVTQPKSAADYLLLAIQERGNKAAELRLKAADILIREKRFTEAANSLAVINIAGITPTLAFNVVATQANALLEKGDVVAALNRMTDPDLPKLSNAQSAELALLKAKAFELQKNPLSAALVLSDTDKSLAIDRQHDIHNRIWSLLTQVDTETLVASSFANYGFNAQGWIELALAMQQNHDLASQQAAIEKWLTLWATHPAKLNPPDLLAALISADLVTAERILVALPFSGALKEPARIISEGIIAELKLRESKGLTAPELQMIDTEQLSSADDLVKHAEAMKADLVIGPLRGKLIDQLAKRNDLAIPFISFNQTDLTTDNLFELDLGSDQDINEVVARASIEGHKQFALITPAATWGARLADDYKAAIEASGGEIITALSYEVNPELSNQVSTLLNTDKSVGRHKAIRDALGEKVEFDERPRRDIDAILITALPSDARQIAPMIAFHFAGDYPIYASSHLFQGDFNPSRDVDLNNVQFADIPWLVNPTGELNRSLTLERPDTASRLGRLYALGSDAVRVYPYLTQLKSSPLVTIQGETGALSLTSTNRFKRTLTWAKFEQGTPLLLGAPKIPVEPLALQSEQTSQTELN